MVEEATGSFSMFHGMVRYMDTFQKDVSFKAFQEGINQMYDASSVAIGVKMTRRIFLPLLILGFLSLFF